MIKKNVSELHEENNIDVSELITVFFFNTLAIADNGLLMN